MPEYRCPRRWPWIFGASTLLSVTLLAGRLTGLWREIELASAFGLSAHADVAVLLLTLPDLMVNLLLSGGLGAALIPRLRASSPEQAALLLQRAIVVCLAAFGTIAMCVAIWQTSVLGLLAPGLQLPQVSPSAFIAVGAAIPMTAAVGVTAAWLNSQQRYLVAGSGTLIFNFCVIVGLWAVGSVMAPLTALCVGIAAGAALRLLSQLVAIPRSAWHRGRGQKLQDSGLVQCLFTATLASALMSLTPVIVRALASLLGEGAVAAFNYALKLVELPSAILLGSIATVALTTLSDHEARGDSARARYYAQHNIQRGVLLAVAAAAIGESFVLPAVRLVLGRGAMDAQAIELVATLLRIALMGLPAMAVSGIAMAALNASGRPGIVLRCTGLCFLLLPLLALPGVLSFSGTLLMASVVAFQSLQAMLLAHFARLPAFGPEGWLTPRVIFCIALSLGVAGATVGADSALGLSSDALRVLLAGVGFVVAVFLSLRLSR